MTTRNSKTDVYKGVGKKCKRNDGAPPLKNDVTPVRGENWKGRI